MKRLTTILCVAALVAAAASCNKLAESENAIIISQDEGLHEVPIYLSTDDVKTKVSSTVEVNDNSIGQAYAYIFSEDHTKIIYSGYVTNTQKFTISKFKKYHIYVICGVDNISQDKLEALKTVEEIQAFELHLSDMSKDSNMSSVKHLFMYGDALIDKGAESISVTVKRLVCRIRLVSVTQTEEFKSYAGNMKIKYMFLSNVVSNYLVLYNTTSVKKASYEAVYKNKMGRQDQDGMQSQDKSLIINSTERAYAPDWTFYGGDHTSWVTYCFPNDWHGVSPSGWVKYSEYSGQNTMLVIAATFGNEAEVYYYPIDLCYFYTSSGGGTLSLRANYSYDVYVTISNYGSSEPNQTFTNTSAAANITVSDWMGGQESYWSY